MKQKADHHLTFLAERNDKSSTSFLDSLPTRRTNAGQRQASVSRSVQPTTAGGDEDAAGESDDAAGEKDEGPDVSMQDFQDGAKRATTVDQPGQAASQPPECKCISFFSGIRYRQAAEHNQPSKIVSDAERVRSRMAIESMDMLRRPGKA